MWRDLIPQEGDPVRQRMALALARGLWRATRHREEPDPRCDTLLGLAYLRMDDAKRALWVNERIGPRNEKRAPALWAVDLAVAALGHAALGDSEAARRDLDTLDRLLEQDPGLVTARVLSLQAEAHERLGK